MSNSSLGNWHRRGTGHYVRKRGRIYDSVRKIQRGHRGFAWVVYINGEGGKRQFKTRLEATAALDSYIRHQSNSEPSQESPAKSDHIRETVECHKCGGSGIWYGHGYMLNGVFQGPSGKCYACEGKGVETDADQRRNWGYHQNRRIENGE